MVSSSVGGGSFPPNIKSLPKKRERGREGEGEKKREREVHVFGTHDLPRTSFVFAENHRK